MKIINTYIVALKSNNAMLDDEIIKLHELENGKFYKECWKGHLTFFDKEIALRLVTNGS